MRTIFETRAVFFLALLSVLCACKKDNNTPSTNQKVVVKYVITTSLPITSTRNNQPVDNWIAYAGNPGNPDDPNPQTTGFSGSQWTKEINLINVTSKRELGFTAQLHLLGANGTANGKIYINGELKAEVNVPGYATVYEVTTTETKLSYFLP